MCTANNTISHVGKTDVIKNTALYCKQPEMSTTRKLKLCYRSIICAMEYQIYWH